MKSWIDNLQDASATANVNKRRTGLNVNICSDGQGCKRNKPDAIPRVKLVDNDDSISVSISSEPEVLAPKTWRKRFKQETIHDFEEGIEYVRRNNDVFLKHHMDTDLSFDDEDLFNSLRERGEYR